MLWFVAATVSVVAVLVTTVAADIVDLVVSLFLLLCLGDTTSFVHAKQSWKGHPSVHPNNSDSSLQLTTEPAVLLVVCFLGLPCC